jgi:hypothetical protein
MVHVDSETLLVTDFVNFNIKPTQSFECAHRDNVYVRVFIWMSARTCINIYVCTVFLKKKHRPKRRLFSCTNNTKYTAAAIQ